MGKVIHVNYLVYTGASGTLPFDKGTSGFQNPGISVTELVFSVLPGNECRRRSQWMYVESQVLERDQEIGDRFQPPITLCSQSGSSLASNAGHFITLISISSNSLFMNLTARTDALFE